MSHRLLRRDRTWYLRFAVPRDRWEDVGFALAAPGGIKREIVRTLGTTDHRVAEGRRDAAMAELLREIDRKLTRAGKRPLTDWKANWVDRAEHLRVNLAAAPDDIPGQDMTDPDRPETQRELWLDTAREEYAELASTAGRQTADAFWSAATGGNPSVGESADAWLAEQESRGTAPVRLGAHRAVLKLLAVYLKEHHATPSLRVLAFDALTPRVAAGFIAWRAATPSRKRPGKAISKAAITRELSTLRGIWNRARRVEDTTLDPWRGQLEGLPKAASLDDDSGSKRPYSPSELMALFAASADAWAPNGGGYGGALRDISAMALLTGIRLGQLATLRVRDVVEEKTALRLAVGGKTPNARGLQPLSRTAQAILTARLARLPANVQPDASLWPEIPPAARSRLLSTRFPRVRRRILREAGLPSEGHETDFHSFRRSYIRFARAAMDHPDSGGSLNDVLVGTLVGHREKTLAMRTYSGGALPAAMRRAVDTVEAVGFPADLLRAIRGEAD